MTKSGLLTRLHEADPITRELLEQAVPFHARDRVRDEILAGTRPAARSQRSLPVRRFAVGAAAIASVAAVVVAAGVVSRPDGVVGPAPASAAQILHAAGDTARSQPDYVLTGTQRVFSASLLTEGGAEPVVVSAEWWTERNGRATIRTRTYSERASELFGVAVGSSDLERPAELANDIGGPR